MSEIKFIQEFGDALDRAIAADTARQRSPQHTTVWTRLRRLARSHRPMAIILVAATVAGCATAVALSINQQTTTVAYGLVCNWRGEYQAIGDSAVLGAEVGADAIPGPDAIADCERLFRNEHLRVTRADLLACAQTRAGSTDQGVIVFGGTGALKSCQSRGLQPFTAKFHAAMVQVVSLQTAMARLYESRLCWKPEQLVKATQALLTKLAFVGWQATTAPAKLMGQVIPGKCGDYTPAGFPMNDTPGGDGYGGNGLAGLDPERHRVYVMATADRVHVAYFQEIMASIDAALSEAKRAGRVLSVKQYEAVAKAAFKRYTVPAWHIRLEFQLDDGYYAQKGPYESVWRRYDFRGTNDGGASSTFPGVKHPVLQIDVEVGR